MNNNSNVLIKFLYFWINGLLIPILWILHLLLTSKFVFIVIIVAAILYISLFVIPIAETWFILKLYKTYKQLETNTEEEEIRKNKGYKKIIIFCVSQIVIFLINSICFTFIFFYSLKWNRELNEIADNNIVITCLYIDLLVNCILNILFLICFVYDEDSLKLFLRIQKENNETTLIATELFTN